MSTQTMPTGTWGAFGYTVFLYGSSSSMWGKAIWLSSTALSLNRTSSNTQKISVFGII